MGGLMGKRGIERKQPVPRDTLAPRLTQHAYDIPAAHAPSPQIGRHLDIGRYPRHRKPPSAEQAIEGAAIKPRATRDHEIRQRVAHRARVAGDGLRCCMAIERSPSALQGVRKRIQTIRDARRRDPFHEALEDLLHGQ